MKAGTSNIEEVICGDKGQFRVMTMDNVKSFHVMYVLCTYIVIHIFWFCLRVWAL